ncbi:hypothetical protein VPHK250G1_0015 [Vibrio phage K250 g1]
MQEMLIFVRDQISLGMFIGLNTSMDNDGVTIYTVDYWVSETIDDGEGGSLDIKAGKQKTFTF